MRDLSHQMYRAGNQSCNICGATTPLVEHHIHGRNIPDWDAQYNKCMICPTCHDKTHMNPPHIILENWYQTTDGLRLVWHHKGEKSITGCDAVCPKYSTPVLPKPMDYFTLSNILDII